MKRSLRYWIPLFAISVAACGSPPKPEPKATVDEPPPKEESPEPPKCESFKEKCIAKADTWARIASTGLVFQPPKGWMYAQIEEATVTQDGDAGAIMVLSELSPAGNATAVSKIESLAELVELKVSSPINWISTNVLDIGDLKVTLRENSKPANRGGKAGALLGITADAKEGVPLFGIAYAAESDKGGTKAILDAIKTIKKGEPPSEDKVEDESSE